MNQEEKKNALVSIVFYVISILMIVAINVSGKFKSGPCTPNLDVLSVFLLAILNIVLMIANGIRGFLFGKQTRLSFCVHFVALLVWVTCIYFNLL